MKWLLIIFIITMVGQALTLGKLDEKQRLEKERDGVK